MEIVLLAVFCPPSHLRFDLSLCLSKPPRRTLKWVHHTTISVSITIKLRNARPQVGCFKLEVDVAPCLPVEASDSCPERPAAAAAGPCSSDTRSPAVVAPTCYNPAACPLAVACWRVGLVVERGRVLREIRPRSLLPHHSRSHSRVRVHSGMPNRTRSVTCHVRNDTPTNKCHLPG